MEPQLNQYGNAQSIQISAGELAEIRQLQHEVKALRALNRLALELHSITSELSSSATLASTMPARWPTGLSALNSKKSGWWRVALGKSVQSRVGLGGRRAMEEF